MLKGLLYKNDSGQNTPSANTDRRFIDTGVKQSRDSQEGHQNNSNQFIAQQAYSLGQVNYPTTYRIDHRKDSFFSFENQNYRSHLPKTNLE